MKPVRSATLKRNRKVENVQKVFKLRAISIILTLQKQTQFRQWLYAVVHTNKRSIQWMNIEEMKSIQSDMGVFFFI